MHKLTTMMGLLDLDLIKWVMTDTMRQKADDFDIEYKKVHYS